MGLGLWPLPLFHPHVGPPKSVGHHESRFVLSSVLSCACTWQWYVVPGYAAAVRLTDSRVMDEAASH